MTNYVDFETAKRLKEIGFDSPTSFAYCEAGGWNPYKKIEEPITYVLRTDGNPFGVPFLGRDWNSFPDNTKNKIMCSAPTAAQVVMWLYEKHGIWIYVELIDNTKHFYFQPTIINTKRREYWDEDMFDQAQSICNWKEWEFKTPTEAYTSAINYVLTNMKREVIDVTPSGETIEGYVFNVK